MKTLCCICLFLFVTNFLDAQTIATTQDGRKVVLFRNGTWRYHDRNENAPSTDVTNLYEESYKYAYDVVYADEFFNNDRINKANSWAKDYISKRLVIPVGDQSLDDWFKNLYSLAYDNLYKTVVFSPDRKKSALAWAEEVLKEKAFFEDYRLPFIARHRMAYDVAYNHIFSEEFFDRDRKKKALEWANDFIKK